MTETQIAIDSLRVELNSHTFHVEVFPLRSVAEYYLAKYFGERCQDMHADCEICKRWNALDVLLENPFEGDE